MRLTNTSTISLRFFIYFCTHFTPIYKLALPKSQPTKLPRPKTPKIAPKKTLAPPSTLNYQSNPNPAQEPSPIPQIKSQFKNPVAQNA